MVLVVKPVPVIFTNMPVVPEDGVMADMAGAIPLEPQVPLIWSSGVLQAGLRIGTMPVWCRASSAAFGVMTSEKLKPQESKIVRLGKPSNRWMSRSKPCR